MQYSSLRAAYGVSCFSEPLVKPPKDQSEGWMNPPQPQLSSQRATVESLPPPKEAVPVAVAPPSPLPPRNYGHGVSCVLCKQRYDREIHRLIVYVASGVFALVAMDILVRLAVGMSKKR